MAVRRFSVWLLNLDPTVGSEVKKTCPALVVSPNEVKAPISMVIVPPMTTKGRQYPTRLPCTFQGNSGQMVRDQLRTVDKQWLVKRLGVVEQGTADHVLETLAEIFAKETRRPAGTRALHQNVLPR